MTDNVDLELELVHNTVFKIPQITRKIWKKLGFKRVKQFVLTKNIKELGLEQMNRFDAFVLMVMLKEWFDKGSQISMSEHMTAYMKKTN